MPGADGDSVLADALARAGITVNTDPAGGSDLVLIELRSLEKALGDPVLAAALATGRPGDAVGLHKAGGDLAELVLTRLATPAAAAAAAALAARLGWRPVRAPDRPGFLVGTLLYPHLADAVRMVQDGYASPADVDTAMTLGCGYPRGPLELLDEAGPGHRAGRAGGHAAGVRGPGVRAAAAAGRPRGRGPALPGLSPARRHIR